MGQIGNPPTESQLFSYLKSVKIDALTPDFLKFSQPQKLSGENFRRVQEKIEPFLNWSRAKLILYPYFAQSSSKYEWKFTISFCLFTQNAV